MGNVNPYSPVHEHSPTAAIVVAFLFVAGLVLSGNHSVQNLSAVSADGSSSAGAPFDSSPAAVGVRLNSGDKNKGIYVCQCTPR